jgi:cell division protein FtsI/penicillin-binding protein 2
MQSVRALNSGKWGEISRQGNWRVNALALFVLGAAFFILLRLYFVQVVQHQSYQAIAQNQYDFFQTLAPERGEIFLQSGSDLYPVAVNQELQMAYAVPKEIKDVSGSAKKIAEILGMDENLVREKIGNPDEVYKVLKHKLSEDEVAKIKEVKLAGIYLTPEDFRFYPGGELAAQTVGFVASDGDRVLGRYGLENFWDQELQGASGTLNQNRDSRGRWMSVDDRDLNPAEDGQGLVLTINYNIQYEVEKILKEAVEKFRADEGSAIVMDPRTGRILAMANVPSFNLNEFGKLEDISVFDNPTVSGTYECGSVFKTITTAIGIDDGKINPMTTFNDTGLVKEAGYSIKNSDEKAYGQQTMTEMLEKSLNTGAIFVEKQVGNKNYVDYLKRFGFGEKTGIDLPGELAGNIRNLEDLRMNINFFTASFGQGISVTPIQLINAYAAIANGGKLMKPQIVQKVIHADGTEEEIAPEEIRRVIQEGSAKAVGQMLRSVVVRGHGKQADVPGYLVGGKTGTAQVAKSGSKGYEEGLTIGSFAGYAPIDDPQYVILVKIDNPKDVQWAESTAAPVFGKIMKFVLEYGKVEPTEEIDIQKMNKAATPVLAPEKPVAVTKDNDKKKKN